MYYNLILLYCLSMSWIHDTEGFIALKWSHENYAGKKIKYDMLWINTENRKDLGISDDFVLMNIYKIFPRRTRLRRVWRPSIIETTLYDIFFWAISYAATVMFITNMFDEFNNNVNYKRFAIKTTTLIKVPLSR